MSNPYTPPKMLAAYRRRQLLKSIPAMLPLAIALCALIGIFIKP